MKTFEKQETENGPFVATNGKRRCFVCKQPIEEGQSFYRLHSCSYAQARHVLCLRTKVYKKKHDPERQEIGRASNGRVIRSAKGL